MEINSTNYKVKKDLMIGLAYLQEQLSKHFLFLMAESDLLGYVKGIGEGVVRSDFFLLHSMKLLLFLIRENSFIPFKINGEVTREF